VVVVPQLDDRTLQVLAESVRTLISTGELSPLEGLTHVIWPSPEVVEASREVAAEQEEPHLHRASTKRKALALIERGYSQGAAAREVGVPRTSLSVWIRADRRERGIEEPGVAAMPKGFRQHWEAKAESAA
jgi:hypothetical protein